MSVEPKKLTDRMWREIARRIRNDQWAFMERVAEHGTIWFCVWNKRGLPELEDERRCALNEGLELLGWFRPGHPDWLDFGDWDDDRCAMPVTITDAGRAALANRDAYDMEPVHGGLVEPGWQAIPLAPEDTWDVREHREWPG